MQKLRILKLSVELTRKCNLKCCHCMKGDAQNVDIGRNYIEKLCNFVSEVNVLHITGGEPSMNTSGMRHLINTIRKENITIHSINVIFNGRTNYACVFLKQLEELNALTMHPDRSRFSVSVDVFHGEGSNSSLKNFFSGYNAVKNLQKETSLSLYPYFTSNYPPLLATGRAKSLPTAVDPDDPNKCGNSCIMPIITHGNTVDWLHLSANGVICVDGNQSYEYLDNSEHNIGHIDDFSTPDDLLSGIEKWNNKKDVRIRGALFDIGRQLLSVCKDCPVGHAVYVKKIQYVKAILESQDFLDYPQSFKNSEFIAMLNSILAEYEDIQADPTLTLNDCNDCMWWDFEHLGDVII